MTSRVHGEDALRAALEVTGFLFGGLEPSSLSRAALEVLSAEAPFVEVKETDVNDGALGLDMLKLLVASGLTASNGAARRLLEQGGVSVNKRKLGAQERYVDASALLLGSFVILGKGKKEYAVVRVIR
jgi:tyrosyl-tRNA synthetase